MLKYSFLLNLLRNMKGISLPVNVLVILIVAVVILLAVIILFVGGWTGVSVIDSQLALNKARGIITNYNCESRSLDQVVTGSRLVNKDSDDTVRDVCKYNTLNNDNDCLKIAGCRV